MITRQDDERRDTGYLRFHDALKSTGFEDEIAPDFASRTVLAIDNATFQRLLSHCTEATNAAGKPKALQLLFASFGRELELVNNGCCGMFGTDGHEARVWKPAKPSTPFLGSK